MHCRNCGKELVGDPEICVNCGARPAAGTGFCPSCGASVTPLAEICIKCGTRVSGTPAAAVVAEPSDISPKSRTAATLLAFFLGTFGGHRFYLGKTGTAVVMLLLGIIGIATTFFVIGYVFLTVVWIWAIIDFIFCIIGRMRDKEGRLVEKW